MNSRISWGLGLVWLLTVYACQAPMEKADIIVYAAQIYTLNEYDSVVSAMAIKNGRILFTGNDADVQKFKGEKTQLVDLKGNVVYPGFIDSHVHLMMGAAALAGVDLRAAESPKSFIDKVKTYASKKNDGQWLLEGNWDHTLWGGILPDKQWIDSISSQNPALLYRLDHHMALANSRALALAGITAHTKDPEGGKIDRDAAGHPTGILRDKAIDLVLTKIYTGDTQTQIAHFKAAEAYLLSCGITTAVDVLGLSGPFESIGIAQSLEQRGDLRLRLCIGGPLQEWKNLAPWKHFSTTYIKGGMLKGFVDGSLGAGTAALHRPYQNEATNTGLLLQPTDSLEKWVMDAHRAGWQIMLHAIGDKANHLALNALEKTRIFSSPIRHRIEHAQHLDERDMPRFGRLNIIASMQPYHAIDDGRWAEEKVGTERIKTSYAYRTLTNLGTTIAFGSDWPVAPASVLAGIEAAVYRRTLDGKNENGWHPEQRISMYEALRAYTIHAAKAIHDEAHRGSLQKGKWADFVVLNASLTDSTKSDLQNVRVLQTWVGGKRVYAE